MASTFNEAMGSAKDAMATAKEGTEHAYASTRSLVMDGVHLLAGIVPMLRSFSYDGILSHVGLARRRSPFEGVAIFGAGIVVGAGIGVLFAPMSGDRLRRTMLRSLKRDASDAVSRVEGRVEKIERKAEEIADKAKSAALKVEHKIEDGVNAVENVARDAKEMVSAASNGVDEGKAQKPQRPDAHARRPS